MGIKLYGVVHGAYGPFGQQINVHPSAGMITQLLGLPKNSRVGIEWPRELCDDGKLSEEIDINGVLLRVPGGIVFYWQRVLNFCSMAGHEPVFLDDHRTFRKYLHRFLDVYSKESGQLDLFSPGMSLNEQH
jgi:hypothetical protein